MSSLYSLGLYTICGNPDRIIRRTSSSVPTMNQITSNKQGNRLVQEPNPIHIALLDQSHSHYCSLGPIPFTSLSWTNPIHMALIDRSLSHCSLGLIPFTLLSWTDPIHMAVLHRSHSHCSLGPIPFTLLSWTNPIHMALLDRSHSHGSLGPISLGNQTTQATNGGWVPTFEHTSWEVGR
jgi:hypothetical protein